MNRYYIIFWDNLGYLKIHEHNKNNLNSPMKEVYNNFVTDEGKTYLGSGIKCSDLSYVGEAVNKDEIINIINNINKL